MPGSKRLQRPHACHWNYLAPVLLFPLNDSNGGQRSLPTKLDLWSNHHMQNIVLQFLTGLGFEKASSIEEENARW